MSDDPSIAPETSRTATFHVAPRTERPIDRATHGATHRSRHARSDPSIAQSDVPETSRTATFHDSNRTSNRVKHRPARCETKIGTPISRRFRSKHRAQRRLQLCCLEKRKRIERNRGSQKHQKDSVKLFKVAFRVGESTRFLEESKRAYRSRGVDLLYSISCFA